MTNSLKNKRVLVTGGAGFIGCNLVRRLIKQGAHVRVFDNFSTGKRDNLKDIVGVNPPASVITPPSSSVIARSENACPELVEGKQSQAPSLDIFEGDLRDFALILEATKDIEIIFHQAALPSVIRSVRAPNTTNDVNITGTLNLLEAARANSVKKVIYASSSSIYGDSETLPKIEDMIPNPSSPYAVSKIAGEHYMKVFSHLYGINTIILRYFNVYGPYQDPNSEYSGVIAKFITAFINGKPITVYGDGEQSRDFTFVDDVVEANILAASTEISGEVFNVAGGNRHTLNQMIKILKSIFKKDDYQVVYKGVRQGDVKHSQADVGKVKETLDFEAQMSFDKGLRQTTEWYRE